MKSENNINIKYISSNEDDRKDLNKYNEELLSDVSLTKNNFREKALMVSGLRCKWLNYLFYERDTLRRINKKKEEIKSKQVSEKYSDPLVRIKAEERLMKIDEKMKKLEEYTKETKENIDFLQMALNIMDEFGLNIKNYIDAEKLERR